MKNLLVAFLVLVICPLIVSAQFRGAEPLPPSSTEGMVAKSPSSGILGLINPENFRMSQSVSMSYENFGGVGIGLTMYTNSLQYRIADPLTVSADVSLMYSPFNTLPTGMKNQFNGVFLQRAQVDYAPSKDLHISLLYRDCPGASYLNSPYGRSFYSRESFNDAWSPFP